MLDQLARAPELVVAADTVRSLRLLLAKPSIADADIDTALSVRLRNGDRPCIFGRAHDPFVLHPQLMRSLSQRALKTEIEAAGEAVGMYVSPSALLSPVTIVTEVDGPAGGRADVSVPTRSARCGRT